MFLGVFVLFSFLIHKLQNYATWIFSSFAPALSSRMWTGQRNSSLHRWQTELFPCTLNEPRFTSNLHWSHHRKTQANGSCSEIPTPRLKISAVSISTCKIYLGSHYRWMKSRSMTNSARGKFHWPHSGIISGEENHTLNFILVPKSWLRHTCTIETSRQVRGIAALVSKHRLTSWRTVGFWRHWWKRGKSSYHEDVTEEVVDREDNEVDFPLSPWHTAFNQSSNKEINCNLYY